MDTTKIDLQQKNHTKIVRLGVIILTLFVYVSFFIADGAVMCVDTGGYLNMALSREPGYSLLVNLFLGIFGEGAYADVIVICQLAFSAVVTCIFTFSIAKLYEVKPLSEVIIWLLQMFFLLLCYFGSERQAIYPSTLLTEGVTYSLYFLFVKGVLQLNREYSAKRLTEVMIYCTLMMFVRTQLAVCFMGVFAFFFIKAVFKQFVWKRLFLITGVSVACMMAVMLSCKLYTQVVYGVSTGVVGSNSFIIVSGLYGADEEDVDLFSEEQERQMFAELYAVCMEDGMNYKCAPVEGLFADANHYSDSFDRIKFDTVLPYFRDYCISMGMDDSVLIEIQTDELSKEIGWPLLIDNIGIKAKVFMQEIGNGLMRTVGKATDVLLVPIAVIYLAYFTLMVFGFRKTDKGPTSWGALFILIMMLGNIVATGFMIFGEPRYLLYNMVPFYTLGYLMLREAWVARKEKKYDSSTLSHNME